MPLFSLNDNLIQLVCSEWLDMEDLACLDSAVCHGTIRQYFVNMLACDGFTALGRHTDLEDDEARNPEGYVHWLSRRSLKVLRFHSLRGDEGHRDPPPAFMMQTSRMLSLSMHSASLGALLRDRTV